MHAEAPTRVGIIGAGSIARAHAVAFKAQPGVDVVIARGTNPARAEKLAAETNCGTTASFQSLLDDPLLQAVVICVPTDLHADYICEAASAGKHVLCEKPIALNIEDANRAVSRANQARIELMIAHCLRFWDAYAIAREIMQSGRLGRILSISCRRVSPLLRSALGANGWRQDAKRGGGAVIDCQIHDFDFLTWTLGLPLSIASAGLTSDSGSYDHVISLLNYPSGAAAITESSFIMPLGPAIMAFSIVTDAATLEFEHREEAFSTELSTASDAAITEAPSGVLMLRARHAQPARLVDGGLDPLATMFARQAAAFIDLIHGIRWPEVPSPSEAVSALMLALASWQSCDTRATVTVPQ